jgi:hypothetical protein
MHYIPFPPYFIFISSKISSYILASKYSLSFHFLYIRQNSFTASYFMWRCDPTRSTTSSFLRFLDHIKRRTIFSKTSLDEWSAGSRDLYLTTHKTHNRQTSKPPTGFEPTTSAGERPQTYAVDGAATGTGTLSYPVPLVRSDDIIMRIHF